MLNDGGSLCIITDIINITYKPLPHGDVRLDLGLAVFLFNSHHRRTGQHPSFGRADRVLPEWIQWGGGGSSRNFPGSIFCGGGVVAEIFRDPYSVGGGSSSRNFPGSIFCGVAQFFP